jgi:[acyl-carrier-protein] S-malonyltransferase
VRWIEVVQFISGQGAKRIVECGPGKVLTGLCKRIAADAECFAVTDAATLAATIAGGT